MRLEILHLSSEELPFSSRDSRYIGGIMCLPRGIIMTSMEKIGEGNSNVPSSSDIFAGGVEKQHRS